MNKIMPKPPKPKAKVVNFKTPTRVDAKDTKLKLKK